MSVTIWIAAALAAALLVYLVVALFAPERFS
jgi:K+-transporting ATPase KdpF subunit